LADAAFWAARCCLGALEKKYSALLLPVHWKIGANEMMGNGRRSLMADQDCLDNIWREEC
jgi:hypothetical protein